MCKAAAAAGADEACWMTTDLEVPFMLHHQSSGSQDNFAAHEYMEDLAMVTLDVHC